MAFGRKVSLVMVGAVALVTVMVTGLLVATRSGPAKSEGAAAERSVAVEILHQDASTVSAPLIGYGEVRALREARLATELSGIVTHVHPLLTAGAHIEQGEILFRLDDSLYAAELSEREANLAGLRSAREELESERASVEERLTLMRESEQLARSEWERQKKLSGQAIGNQRDQDAAEREVHRSQEAVLELSSSLSVLTPRLENIDHQIAAAAARCEFTRIRVEQCVIRAPFSGRIIRETVTEGGFVAAGEPVVEIADDTILEIPVRLAAADAVNWLPYRNAPRNTDGIYAALEPARCDIYWTGSNGLSASGGALHRVESFDSETRTVTVVVQVDRQSGDRDAAGPALSPGMLCEAHIPSRPMTDVLPIPRWALTLDGRLRVADADDRLRSRDATLVRAVGDTAYVRADLHGGDRIVVTRLLNAVDGSKLAIEAPSAEGNSEDRARLTLVQPDVSQ